MGLDQFFFKRRKNDPESEPEELMYFRKHSDLQGYMEQLYRRQGGEGEFNCESLPLDVENINYLKSLIRHELIEPGSSFNHTSGFFWGQSSRLDWRETLDFLESIEDFDYENYELYYYSWW